MEKWIGKNRKLLLTVMIVAFIGLWSWGFYSVGHRDGYWAGRAAGPLKVVTQPQAPQPVSCDPQRESPRQEELRFCYQQLAIVAGDVARLSTNCEERKRRFDSLSDYQDSWNLLRRDCGDEEAARHIEATLIGTDAEGHRWWGERLTPTPAPTPTPWADACSGRELPTAEYVRCRCDQSGECR